MTTLGEITVVQALLGGIFGWVLVELWQRALDGFSYDLFQLDHDWLTTLLIAILATTLFLVFLFWVDIGGRRPGPNFPDPTLEGVGPTKTFVNYDSPHPYGPSVENLRRLRRPQAAQPPVMGYQALGAPFMNYQAAGTPEAGMARALDEEFSLFPAPLAGLTDNRLGLLEAPILGMGEFQDEADADVESNS